MVQRSQMGLLMLQMRLLCTYFGAGTEFVENRYADRRPLQRMLFQDTQGYGIRDESAVQSASPGDVLYLKGHAFPGNAGLRICCPHSMRGTHQSAVAGNMQDGPAQCTDKAPKIPIILLNVYD